MLAEENNPYVVAFIFFMLSTTVSLFGLGFLNRFAWLRDSSSMHELLGAAGLIMSLIGGVWYSFQTHLGRMLGFAAMAEVGFSLLAISIGDGTAIFLFFALMVHRAISYFLIALGIGQISELISGDLNFEAFRGLGVGFLPAAGLIFLSQLSLAGMPLLAGFPYRFALLQRLAEQNIFASIAVLVSSGGLLLGALRTFGVLMDLRSQDSKTENLAALNSSLQFPSSSPNPGSMNSWIILAFVFIFLLLLGMFPQALMPLLEPLPDMFDQLVQQPALIPAML
jgi:formate hydrogenlyase subunit 3/multisubunit Na+/H+ antiporter MnhD subunit